MICPNDTPYTRPSSHRVNQCQRKKGQKAMQTWKWRNDQVGDRNILARMGIEPILVSCEVRESLPQIDLCLNYLRLRLRKSWCSNLHNHVRMLYMVKNMNNKCRFIKWKNSVIKTYTVNVLFFSCGPFCRVFVKIHFEWLLFFRISVSE